MAYICAVWDNCGKQNAQHHERLQNQAFFFGGGGGLIAWKQWTASSLKHDSVPKVINLYCFI